jgi:LAO/AO transport system kinase
VNKADLPGVERTRAALGQMLGLRASDSPSASPDRPQAGWQPPLLATTATELKGARELLEAIEAHRGYLAAGAAGRERERARARRACARALEQAVRDLLDQRLTPREVDDALERIAQRVTDPPAVAEKLLKRLGLPPRL